MTADINLWNPYTQEENDLSLSQFWLVNGEYGQDLDSIEAGAVVYIISSSSFLLGAF